MAKMLIKVLAAMASYLSSSALKCYESPQGDRYVDITPRNPGGMTLEDYPFGLSSWRAAQLSEKDNARYPGVDLPSVVDCPPGALVSSAGPIAGVDDSPNNCSSPWEDADGTAVANPVFPANDQLYCYNKAAIIEVIEAGTPNYSALEPPWGPVPDYLIPHLPNVPAAYAEAAASAFTGVNIKAGSRLWVRDVTMIGCNLGQHHPWEGVMDDLSAIDCSHTPGQIAGHQPNFGGTLDCSTGSNTRNVTIGTYECSFCYIPDVFYMFGRIKFFTVQCRCGEQDYTDASKAHGGYVSNPQHSATQVTATTADGTTKTWNKGDYCNVEMLRCMEDKFKETFSNNMEDPASYISDFSTVPDGCRTIGERWTAEMLERDTVTTASLLETSMNASVRKHKSSMVRSRKNNKVSNPSPLFMSSGLPIDLWYDAPEQKTKHEHVAKRKRSSLARNEVLTATMEGTKADPIVRKNRRSKHVDQAVGTGTFAATLESDGRQEIQQQQEWKFDKEKIEQLAALGRQLEASLDWMGKHPDKERKMKAFEEIKKK